MLTTAEQCLYDRIKRAGKAGVPALTSIADARARDALVADDLIRWRVDRQRWVATVHDEPPAPPTEVDVTLNLSEYEASVITGALVEYATRWAIEGGAYDTAHALRNLIVDQLPADWKD